MDSIDPADCRAREVAMVRARAGFQVGWWAISCGVAVAQVTSRVSVGASGAQANDFSYAAVLSSDGRFVAFHSAASTLVPGDTNGKFDVFVRDRLLGTTELVSVALGGGPADGDSFVPSISADGRYIAFQSDADNLVVGDTNHRTDVFVRDRLNGTTERVDVDSSGGQADDDGLLPGDTSPDGRYVSFYSRADNLVPGDTNGAF
jgi:Tol biopolymer transport system component